MCVGGESDNQVIVLSLQAILLFLIPQRDCAGNAWVFPGPRGPRKPVGKGRGSTSQGCVFSHKTKVIEATTHLATLAHRAARAAARGPAAGCSSKRLPTTLQKQQGRARNPQPLNLRLMTSLPAFPSKELLVPTQAAPLGVRVLRPREPCGYFLPHIGLCLHLERKGKPIFEISYSALKYHQPIKHI